MKDKIISIDEASKDIWSDEILDFSLREFLDFAGIKRDIDKNKFEKVLGKIERTICLVYLDRLEVYCRNKIPGFKSRKNNTRAQIYKMMLPKILERVQEQLELICAQYTPSELIEIFPSLDFNFPPKDEMDEFIMLHVRTNIAILRFEAQNDLIKKVTYKIIEKLSADISEGRKQLNNRFELPELRKLKQDGIKVIDKFFNDEERKDNKKIKNLWQSYFIKPNGKINQNKLAVILKELDLSFFDNIRKMENFIKAETKRLKLFTAEQVLEMKSIQQRYQGNKDDFTPSKSNKSIDKRILDSLNILKSLS